MSPDAQALAAAVRRGAGLFPLADRGLLEVSGSDRVRWLDGMVSNDVSALEPGAERSGCYALLLTPQGRIVADLRVLLRPESLWLETDAGAVARVVERLERFIVADDVRLSDRSTETARLGLEGPAAEAVLRALGAETRLAAGACGEARLAGAEVLVAAYGWSGEPAYQIFCETPAAAAVEAALLEAGRECGLVRAGPEVLEILRIEAGVPRFGRELDEDVLPAEARLERAVSRSKGCYTGQEVVARMESRGRVAHLLVGLRCEDAPPGAGEAIRAGEKRVGEVTSACRSPAAGAIALAYVRRAHAEPGTELAVGGRSARVAPLPFTTASA